MKLRLQVNVNREDKEIVVSIVCNHCPQEAAVDREMRQKLWNPGHLLPFLRYSRKALRTSSVGGAPVCLLRARSFLLRSGSR